MTSKLPTAVPPNSIRLSNIIEKLEIVAPLDLAESWDNTGLLAGDLDSTVHRVMMCLTVSPKTVQEAIGGKVQLVVTHHPLPFKPLQQIVTSTSAGKSLWALIRAGIAIYSPHTAWDNAAHGINFRLANMLNLTEIRPIREIAAVDPQGHCLGVGRMGRLAPPRSIAEIIELLRSHIPSIRATTNQETAREFERVAIVCGSGGSFAEMAQQAGANLLLTGEATYHQCLEAQSMGLGMLMIGHFQSERFSMDALTGILKAEFPTLDVWTSRDECDPVIEVD